MKISGGMLKNLVTMTSMRYTTSIMFNMSVRWATKQFLERKDFVDLKPRNSMCRHSMACSSDYQRDIISHSE